MYFDSPYYLGPAEGAEKAYSLLAAAMEASGKVAIARFVFRNKEHLAAIRPAGGVLTLTTMRFADEVVPADRARRRAPRGEGRRWPRRSVEMAEQLIDSLTTDFDPAAYRDEYREQLLALIERKAEGKEIVAPEAEEPKATKAPDLMAALEESIAAVKGKRSRRKAKAAPKPKRERPKQVESAKPKRSSRRQSQSLEIAVADEPRGRGRRAGAEAHQPRQGPLPEGRLHQGRDGRLLRQGGAGDGPPPERPRR